MKRRLPPFGRCALKSQSDLRRVACGMDAWRFALDHRERGGIPPLVLPPDESPTELQWPVNGKMVLIIPCGYISRSERALLASALLRGGAYACLFVDTNEWCGKLPEDSLFWTTNKKPAALAGATG